MKKLAKLTMVAVLFLATLMTSNVAKAQPINEPSFITRELYCEVGLGMSYGGISYEIYTAGYNMESMSFDDETGTVMVVQESYYETGTNLYLWSLRVFGITIGYTEVTLSITYNDGNGYECTITTTLRCLVVDIEFGYWTRATDSQPLSPLSTDSNRLPAIVPTKN